MFFISQKNNRYQLVVGIKRGHTGIAVTIICQKQAAFFEITFAVLSYKSRILGNKQIKAFISFVEASAIIG